MICSHISENEENLHILLTIYSIFKFSSTCLILLCTPLWFLIIPSTEQQISNILTAAVPYGRTPNARWLTTWKRAPWFGTGTRISQQESFVAVGGKRIWFRNLRPRRNKYLVIVWISNCKIFVRAGFWYFTQAIFPDRLQDALRFFVFWGRRSDTSRLD